MSDSDDLCPALRGERVSLEPLVEAHAVGMFPLVVDPEVWRYTDAAPPRSAHELTLHYSYLESRRSPDGAERWLNWAVRAVEDVVGFVQATVVENREVSIAYLIGRLYWSRSYATDAVGVMMQFLEVAYPRASFHASVDSQNVASVKLLRRLQFELVDDSDPKNVQYVKSRWIGARRPVIGSLHFRMHYQGCPGSGRDAADCE